MAPATSDDISKFRTIAGQLAWLGCGVLPQAALVGSEMQQRILSENRIIVRMKFPQKLIRFLNNLTDIIHPKTHPKLG